MSTRALQTPNTFTQAWSTRFTEIVTAAAGKDGRLSRAEAARLGSFETTAAFADNAWVPFAAGQKSVSAKKPIATQSSAVLAAAKVAAGLDGRLSAKDAAKLPSLFQADYFALKAAPAPVPGGDRSMPELQADVADQTLSALDNGTAVKLSAPPAELKGARALQTHLAHDASKTFLDTYVVNGTVYASRGSDQPNDQDGWYRIGALAPKGTGRAALRGAVDAATAGLWLTSESDAQVRFVNGGAIGSQPITEALVREKLGAAHDALEPTIYGYPNDSFVKLADRTAEPARDGKAYLARLSTAMDPNDPTSVAQAQKWAELAKTLESNLTDLQVYRFGSVNLSVLIVGRTRSGDLAGVVSGAVET